MNLCATKCEPCVIAEGEWALPKTSRQHWGLMLLPPCTTAAHGRATAETKSLLDSDCQVLRLGTVWLVFPDYIQLHVEWHQGKCSTVDSDQNDTVGQLKQQVQKKIKWRDSKQVLLSGEQLLDDKCTLRSYEIFHGDSLQLVVQPTSLKVQIHQVALNEHLPFHSLVLQCPLAATGFDLKHKIHYEQMTIFKESDIGLHVDAHTVPPSTLVVGGGGAELAVINDSFSLQHYQMSLQTKRRRAAAASDFFGRSNLTDQSMASKGGRAGNNRVDISQDECVFFGGASVDEGGLQIWQFVGCSTAAHSNTIESAAAHISQEVVNEIQYDATLEQVLCRVDEMRKRKLQLRRFIQSSQASPACILLLLLLLLLCPLTTSLTVHSDVIAVISLFPITVLIFILLVI